MTPGRSNVAVCPGGGERGRTAVAQVKVKTNKESGNNVARAVCWWALARVPVRGYEARATKSGSTESNNESFYLHRAVRGRRTVMSQEHLQQWLHTQTPSWLRCMNSNVIILRDDWPQVSFKWLSFITNQSLAMQGQKKRQRNQQPNRILRCLLSHVKKPTLHGPAGIQREHECTWVDAATAF